jgi:hypothetical protein
VVDLALTGPSGVGLVVLVALVAAGAGLILRRATHTHQH